VFHVITVVLAPVNIFVGVKPQASVAMAGIFFLWCFWMDACDGKYTVGIHIQRE
jgi:hypothetical protein